MYIATNSQTFKYDVLVLVGANIGREHNAALVFLDAGLVVELTQVSAAKPPC